MRDFAWSSVKLFLPATGAPGFTVLEVATAGVWASGLAGVVCATALAAERTMIAPAMNNFIIAYPKCLQCALNATKGGMFRTDMIPRDEAWAAKRTDMPEP